MTTLMFSILPLWGVALARQIGVLHERVAPASALLSAAGPGVDGAGLLSATELVKSRELLANLIILKESRFAALPSYLLAQLEAVR